MTILEFSRNTYEISGPSRVTEIPTAFCNTLDTPKMSRRS